MTKKIACPLLLMIALLMCSPGGIPAEEEAAARVALETGLGVIIIELDRVKAPRTTENFLQYARDGFYDGTVFHRAIPGFMIQGGGFTPEMRQKATMAAISNEADNGLTNRRGTIAMARTGDPHSATAQFFVNTVDNAFLNHQSRDARGWGYCVFGRVAEGMDVVDAITRQPTRTVGAHQNVPVTPVVIERARILKHAESE